MLWHRELHWVPSPVPFRHAFVPVSQLSGLAPRAPHIPMPHEFFQTLALLPSALFSSLLGSGLQLLELPRAQYQVKGSRGLQRWG